MTDVLARTRRPGRTATVVAALIFVAAGCGASTGAVKSGSTTTTSASTTEAPTTQAPTTEAPTTEAPTTQAPATTTGGTGGKWPASVETQFLASCEAGDSSKAPLCECALRAIETEISVADLAGIGSGSLPADVQAKITKAATECALDPTSH